MPDRSHRDRRFRGVGIAIGAGLIIAGVLTSHERLAALSTASQSIAPADSVWSDAPRRTPEEWGRNAFEAVLESVNRLVSPEQPLRDRLMAANLIVSRMDNGPRRTVTRWSEYLEHGLGNGSCGRRSELLASIVRHWDPSVPIRFAGMASVPGQASHTTLEVLLPGEDSWSWFDPSAGIFFTEDGSRSSRILSQQEVFSDPSIVDRIGPIAPRADRIAGPPRAVRLVPPLDRHLAAEPGFSRPGFPLRRMLELATAWGSGDPDAPTPAFIDLDLQRTPSIEAARLTADGDIQRLVLRDDQRRLTWHDRLGVSASGINSVPVVRISGCRPGQPVLLRIRFVPRHPDVDPQPLVTSGGRLATSDLIRTGRKAGKDPECELRARIVPDAPVVHLAVLHGGDAPQERAVVLLWQVEGSGPPGSTSNADHSTD